jgi:hypothetical protein
VAREVLTGLTPEAAQAIYEALLARGEPLRPEQSAWDELTGSAIPLLDTPQAGLMAAQGRLSLEVELAGVAGIPQLTLTIRPGSVVLAGADRRAVAALAADLRRSYGS